MQDIYLQKSGTSQLGITLGYDTKSSSGNLVVCEVRESSAALSAACRLQGALFCG